MAKTSKRPAKQAAAINIKGRKPKHRVRISGIDKGGIRSTAQGVANGRAVEDDNGVRGDVPGRSDLLNTIKAVHDNFLTLADLMGREQMVRLVLNHLHHS